MKAGRRRFEGVALLERLATLSIEVDGGGGELASGYSIVEKNRKFGVSTSLRFGKSEVAPGDT